MATITTTHANNEVGESIPAMTAHAVSVSLPTWRSNVGYEEGEEWVVSKMKTGYPRFFINKTIEALANAILIQHAQSSDRAMLFPSPATAERCATFIRTHASDLDSRKVRILDFEPKDSAGLEQVKYASPRVSAVLFPGEVWSVAKQYWQHSGDGVSSRRAEYCHELLKAGMLTLKKKEDDAAMFCKGPKRYRKNPSADLTATLNGTHKSEGADAFIEERFGRNLELQFAEIAKSAVKRRIAGSLTADVPLEHAMDQKQDEARTRDVPGFSEDDIYLYSCGMNAIFNTHQTILAARGDMKSVMYGFPYVDTLKILQKFGPGCIFYGRGNAEELDDLESRLQGGEKLLSLFCEFPGNPLLKSPDLARIRALADKYQFIVVVDETIGNFLNVNVLQFADVVVSSLTKVFSGDSNVMGGSAILNPKGPFYPLLKQTWNREHEDNYWAEDAIFMERNSRDFVSRIDRINANAEAVCEVLRQDPKVKEIMYPKFNACRPFYERCRNANGGYGGLLSATFHKREHAVTFFDALDTAKGPSLGTNFTLR